jgi:hypothetical protein
MRALYLLPLAYVTGIEGFDLFAPYLVGLMVTAYVVSRLRMAPRPAPLPATTPAISLTSSA